VTESLAQYEADGVQGSIITVRGEKVILDADLARIYGVATKVLNQAVKRNADKFPDDFMFRLTKGEAEDLRRLMSQFVTGSDAALDSTQGIDNKPVPGNRSQSVTGSQKHRDPRFRPHAFTEHGAIMAATVLNSPRAVQMSVFVVRAFVRMRSALSDTRELARKLAVLEREVKARLDTHDAAIVDVLSRIMDLIAPPEFAEPPKKRIGFGACPTKPSGRSRVKEKRAKYRTAARPTAKARRTGRNA